MNNQNIHSLLMRHEGEGPMKNGRSFPYRDSVGKLTIGYGRNLTDLGISQAEKETLLTNDILRVIGELRLMCPWFDRLDVVRQDAIVDAGFNLGLTKLLMFHEMMKALHDGAFPAAAGALMDSNAARELPARYGELATMLKTGTYA